MYPPMNTVEHDFKEQFFDKLEQQIIGMVKSIENKLDSVRKERETAISIIEGIVK